MKGARDVTITLRLDEHDDEPAWTPERVTIWLKQNLDFKEDVIDIIDIQFPRGMRGDMTDEDIGK